MMVDELIRLTSGKINPKMHANLWNGSIIWHNYNTSWHVAVLPFIEQSALYAKFPFTPGPPTVANGYAGTDMVNYTIPGGPLLRQVKLPYLRCPTDSTDEMLSSAFQASYSGSLGSQATVSANGSCNQFQQFAQKPGDHGNIALQSELSGIFTRVGQGCKLNQVTDGLSNTIFVGEVLMKCTDHSGGGWIHFNNGANAHASTVCPINDMTTCPPGTGKITNPSCTAQNNWNYSWGFKSQHPGGAQFLLGDGSARFLGDTINHQTYQRLGGKADGLVIGSDF